MNVNEMTPDDATLIAFLDGALSEKERGLVERRIAQDASLRARLDELAGGSRPFRESGSISRARPLSPGLRFPAHSPTAHRTRHDRALPPQMMP